MQGHNVLLNRAPTLYQLGIQVFQPISVEGELFLYIYYFVVVSMQILIEINQVVVHISLSLKAQGDTHLLLFSRINLVSSY